MGTGLGAGVLYLAVNGGSAGLILFILSAVISYPVAYISQKYIMNLILNSKDSLSLTSAIGSYTGKINSYTFIYVYGIGGFLTVLAFAVGINSMAGNIIMQLGISEVNLSINPLFSFLIINGITLLMVFGEKILIAVTEKLTIFLLFALAVVTILLIPNWNLSSVSHIDIGVSEIASNICQLIPLLIFSVVLVPPLAPMVHFFRTEHKSMSKKELEFVCYRSFRTGFWVLAIFIGVFSISCFLAMTPESLEYALKHNISALAALDIGSASAYTSFLRSAGVIITIFALLTSYYGCGLGFVETVASNSKFWKYSFDKKKKIIAFMMGISVWFFTTFNFSVIGIIGLLITPCIGYIYFALPVLIIRKNTKLVKYRNWINYIVIALGSFIIVSFSIGILLQK
jgi:serine transporter